MTSPPDEATLAARLPSTLDSYHEFVQTVLDRLQTLGWPEGELFGIHMALEESISNAIRHGNRLDPAKSVDVECRVEPRRFWARICDEGPGFNPDAVPDCCSPDRLEVPGGRGLTLIRAYMTTARYNACGNCLTLEKSLESATSDAALPGSAQ